MKNKDMTKCFSTKSFIDNILNGFKKIKPVGVSELPHIPEDKTPPMPAVKPPKKRYCPTCNAELYMLSPFNDVTCEHCYPILRELILERIKVNNEKI